MTSGADIHHDTGPGWTDAPSADLESAQHIWLHAVELTKADETLPITNAMVVDLLHATGLRLSSLLHAQRLGIRLGEAPQRTARVRALQLVEAAIAAIGTRPESNEARRD